MQSSHASRSPSADRLGMVTPPPQASGTPEGLRRVLRVPEDFDTISAAIQISRPEDRISVSAGHYMETLDVCDAVIEIVGNGNMQVSVYVCVCLCVCVCVCVCV